MKRKLLVVLIALVSIFALAFGLSACSSGNGGGNTGGGTEQGGDKKPEKLSGSEGLEYTLTHNGTYSCTGIGTCTETDIIIASWYNERWVTEFDSSAFAICETVTSIVIPDSIKSKIDSHAFRNCNALTSITI
ncbi:MAG: leucine-rich repeat protein, partial [Candidatus Coproplasma sp.]